MKPALLSILLFSLLLTVVAAPCRADSAPICGDVNDSGARTASDALLVLRGAVGQDVSLPCSGYETIITSCASGLDSCVSGLDSCEGDVATCTSELTSTASELAQCDSDASSLNGVLGDCNAALATCNQQLTEAQAKPVCGDGVCEAMETPYLGGCSACLSDCGQCSSDGTRFNMHGTCGNGSPIYSTGRLIVFCPGGGSCSFDPAAFFSTSCSGTGVTVECMWVIPPCPA